MIIIIILFFSKTKDAAIQTKDIDVEQDTSGSDKLLRWWPLNTRIRVFQLLIMHFADIICRNAVITAFIVSKSVASVYCVNPVHTQVYANQYANNALLMDFYRCMVH